MFVSNFKLTCQHFFKLKRLKLSWKHHKPHYFVSFKSIIRLSIIFLVRLQFYFQCWLWAVSLCVTVSDIRPLLGQKGSKCQILRQFNNIENEIKCRHLLNKPILQWHLNGPDFRFVNCFLGSHCNIVESDSLTAETKSSCPFKILIRDVEFRLHTTKFCFPNFVADANQRFHDIMLMICQP